MSQYNYGKYKLSKKGKIYRIRRWWFNKKIDNTIYNYRAGVAEVNKLAGVELQEQVVGIVGGTITKKRGRHKGVLTKSTKPDVIVKIVSSLKPYKLNYTLPVPINTEPASDTELKDAWRALQECLDADKDAAKRDGYTKGRSPKASIDVRREVAVELARLLKEENSDILTEICDYSPGGNYSELNRCHMRCLVIAFDEEALKKIAHNVTNW